MRDSRGSTTLHHERRALDLVEQLLELPPEEREGRIAAESDGDERLRNRIVHLLAQVEETGGSDAGVFGAGLFAECRASTGDIAAAPTRELGSAGAEAAPRPHLRGDLVDRYRIEREIGRGGMGIVYRAQRADETFDLDVALKVMQVLPGMSAERFERERQVLARLHHPNVARILDGGRTAEGSPYLAMELVDGVPIDRYCDLHGLDLRRRVELFMQVCDGVTHAHRNLVVHRDLKPGNILVDANGVPKLLDFGIAKLLDPEGAGSGDFTQVGLGPMTPEYASPEQVRNEPITVATDVYALGVILFELLTGERPYRFGSRHSRDVEQVVCGTRPPAPSRAVRGGTEPSNRAAQRGATPEVLGRQLEGDLDTVVLTALAKDPVERYATVDDLADDLRRVLERRPIQARPHTWFYLARRFARRNARPVALAAVVVALLLGALGWGIAQNLRAAAEGRRALAEARKLESTNRFLDQLFSAPDPIWGVGREVRVADLLEVALERLDDLESPEGRSQVHRTIGSTYFNMGLVERAEEVLSDALERSEQAFGPDHLDVAFTAQRLALVLSELGRKERALELLERSVPVLRRDNSDQLEVVVTQYARALAEAGRSDRSRRIYESQVDEIRGRSDLVPDDVIAVNNYGVFLMDQGDFERAEEILEEAVRLHDRTPGSPETLLAGILANIASIASSRRDAEVAEPAYLRAIEITRRILGDDHPELLLTRTSLANLYWNVGRLGDAAELVTDVLDRAEAALPPDHPVLAYAQVVTSGVLVDQGRGPEIEPVIRSVIATRQESMPDGHWLISSAENLLGASLLQQGRLDEAEEVLTRALADLRAGVGDEHEKTRQARELLEQVRARR